MHGQIVNFQLEDISEEQYRATCDELAPAFSELPRAPSQGVVADEASGTYGGVYLWESQEAMAALSPRTCSGP